MTGTVQTGNAPGSQAPRQPLLSVDLQLHPSTALLLLLLLSSSLPPLLLHPALTDSPSYPLPPSLLSKLASSFLPLPLNPVQLPPALLTA
jgi:hypothetical protein